MKPKSIFIYLLAALLAAPALLRAQSVWDAAHLAEVKQNIGLPFYAAAYGALMAEADKLLEAEPLSVMMKERTPASGDKHDYMSQARYTWPDPAKPDGLPYITRDGVTNPEIYQLDRERLGLTARRITRLSLAWYFSGEERYARKATELIRTWFFDKATRMNPHLEYAQIVRGENNDHGRSYGVIDAYSFVEMLDGVKLLETSQSFTARDGKQLRTWFSQLTDWMLTNELGRKEAAARNNHGTAYDAQIVAYALYAGNAKLAREVLEAVPEKRIYTQIDPDGRQPHELRRTLAFHYSAYNLSFFIDLARMGRHLGIDLFQAASADGRSLRRAVEFLLPYAGGSRDRWPYQQISGWDNAVQDFCKCLCRMASCGEMPSGYLSVYRARRILRPEDPFNLLYVRPTPADHAFAFAAGQLKLAMQCADRARKEPGNAARRKVVPRTIDRDGSLSLVHPHDWCSGFFAGSLWQMYAYTHHDFWRQSAISWTWPIEEAKWHRGTHDLGFMMYSSFGKAYELTGERSYRDVVVQSAKSLMTRFNPTVGCIRSWDHNRDKWQYPVIIDNLMNLEMLFRATQLTGDSAYWHVAEAHALTTLRNHFRPDHSSYHVVDYDTVTGAVRSKCTHQGYADDSYWSRGQGWGLYGYTMCYRFTRRPAYLVQAEQIADFFLSLPNMPADGIPYWDMKAPLLGGEKEIPRDASAAAVIASALYELSAYVPSGKGIRYREAADKMVDSLSRDYQADPGTQYGFLLLHSVGHHPANVEIDVPLNYADYYYLEALLRRTDTMVLP